MAQHIHRIVPSKGDPIIINVVSPKKDALDLEIEGTEGQNPYFASFKHARLSAALSKNSPVSPSEWETILGSLLLNQRPDPTDTTTISLLKDLELAAQISAKPATLNLTFRRNIEGIHQRIAELVLPRDDDRELDTLAWVANAAERGESLETEVRQLKKEALKEAQEARQLRAKLEELVKEKQRGEEQLLSKFALLLNAKKSKIRDQQRLLSGSLVDESKAAEVAKIRGNSVGSGNADADTNERSTGRFRKRKAAVPSKDPDESSDEFESMQGVEKQQLRADADAGDESTADEQSDLDETTEAEDDSDASGPVPASSKAAAPAKGGKSIVTETTLPNKPPASNTRSQAGEDVVPPPRIELPFGKLAEKPTAQPSGTKQALKDSAMAMDDDTDTEDETDDEL